MRPILATPSEEKGSAKITIGEDTINLSTEEADALLARLSELRPRMLPARSNEGQLPDILPIFVGGTWRFWVKPDWERGGAQLHLSHPALGWVSYHLATPTVREMRDLLLEWTVPGIPPKHT